MKFKCQELIEHSIKRLTQDRKQIGIAHIQFLSWCKLHNQNIVQNDVLPVQSNFAVDC